MHEFNLKMIKIILLILVASVVLNMIGGVTILKSSYYWRTNFFKLQGDYVKTKAEFVEYEYGGIFPWLASLGDSKSLKVMSGEKTKTIPILIYHGVIENPSWQPDEVNVRLSDFRSQMFALKRAGWQTITVEDYIDFTKGKRELPDKSFMLTFDDGRKDSYYPVDPILRTLDYKAVMYVITGRSLGADNEKSPFHLSRMELEKMIEGGRWEIESHGRNDHDYEKIGPNGETGHFMSNKLWLAKENRLETEDEFKKRIHDDLLGSKQDIEKYLGVKALGYAYPFGDYGQATDNFPGSSAIVLDTARSIFDVTFVQAGGSDYPTNYEEDDFLAKRISVSSPMSADELLKSLDDEQDKAIPYQDNFSKNSGWLKGWGTMNFGGNALTITGSETEDSGMAFLGGSHLWNNYFVDMTARVTDGNAFAVSARYNDENNYVACDFSDRHVALGQRLGGKDLADAEAIMPVGFTLDREVRVGIDVYNDKATCYLDGKPVISSPIESALDHGGISLKIWDTTQKGATLTAKDLEVVPAPPSIK
jgi:peptidoglycan/xylan/chitin deacetylase (PgdA/CDA1 family)